MSKTIKKTLIIILVLLFLAGVWVGGRYIYLKQRYKPFFSNVDKENMYVIWKDQYDCGIAKPESLLSLRGNLYVSALRHVSKNDSGKYEVDQKLYCDLLIYVEFPSGYTVYAQLCDANGNTIDSLKLTEAMTLASEDETSRNLYEENYTAIYDAFLTAHEVFGILEIPKEK